MNGVQALLYTPHFGSATFLVDASEGIKGVTFPGATLGRNNQKYSFNGPPIVAICRTPMLFCLVDCMGGLWLNTAPTSESLIRADLPTAFTPFLSPDNSSILALSEDGSVFVCSTGGVIVKLLDIPPVASLLSIDNKTLLQYRDQTPLAIFSAMHIQPLDVKSDTSDHPGVITSCAPTSVSIPTTYVLCDSYSLWCGFHQMKEPWTVIPLLPEMDQVALVDLCRESNHLFALAKCGTVYESRMDIPSRENYKNPGSSVISEFQMRPIDPDASIGPLSIFEPTKDQVVIAIHAIFRQIVFVLQDRTILRFSVCNDGKFARVPGFEEIRIARTSNYPKNARSSEYPK